MRKVLFILVLLKGVFMGGVLPPLKMVLVDEDSP